MHELIDDSTALQNKNNDLCGKKWNYLELKLLIKLELQQDGPTDSNLKNDTQIHTGDKTDSNVYPAVDQNANCDQLPINLSTNPQANNSTVFQIGTKHQLTFSHLACPKTKSQKLDGDHMKINLWFGLFKYFIHNHHFSNAKKMNQLQTLTMYLQTEQSLNFYAKVVCRR